jgi:subfamily B ATP-binding cassette protein HlyB/CyaB
MNDAETPPGTDTSGSKAESTAVAAAAASGVAPSNAEASALDTGLMCFLMLCQFLEVPAEGDQIRHKLGKPGEMFTDVDLLRVAKDMEFKARQVESSWDRLDKTPLPAIAKRKDGTYFILAKVSKDENKVLIQCPEVGRPETKTRDELIEEWDGTLLLMTTREQITGDARKFDISWFIPAVIKYRQLFSEVILASFFIQIFATVSPLFFMVIIDKVLVSRGLSSLDVLIFALVVVSAFEVILGGMRTYIFSHTTNRIDVELGTKLFKHLLQLPISYFGARRVGETVARVRELENIRNFLTGSALTLVVDLVFTIVFFWIMFIFAPVLTWIVMGSIPFYVGFSLLITPALRARVEEKFQRGAANTAFLTESVSGVETLKASAVEPQMQRRWEEQLAGYVQASFKTAQLSNIAQQGVQAIQKITMAATLFFGAKLVIDGDLTVGQLVAFNMLSGRVSQPILRLAQLWQDFQQMRVSVERLGDILNTKVEGSADAGRAKLPPIKGDVEFDGITFRYRDDGPEILRNISLKVPAGQVIGIVGPSGSGKSTLTKLVQRLYLPEKGRVLIDGTDLGLVDPAWLRRQVGVVLQENYLFNRSVRDNIAIADPAMTMERVIEAATQAGAHDFILELPEGYDTLIGERGGTLSGGQRQRIAIARALVTNPRILILDEATSALDYESEEIIQANMRHICKGRTVFTIAHRLSTVRDCDRIITIEAGEVVEDGTHTSLLQTDGRYSKLWRAQAAGTPLADQLPGTAPQKETADKTTPEPDVKTLAPPKRTVPVQKAATSVTVEKSPSGPAIAAKAPGQKPTQNPKPSVATVTNVRTEAPPDSTASTPNKPVAAKKKSIVRGNLADALKAKARKDHH